MRHPLVWVAGETDLEFLLGRFSSVCAAGPSQSLLPTRLVVGRATALG